MEIIEKKESPRTWEATGQVATGERVCPDCFHAEPQRIGLVREYKKEKNGVKRYAYRCESEVKDDVCGATVEVSDFDHIQGGDFTLEVSVIMEKGYLEHKTHTTKSDDFKSRNS
jgi:hypothetical protein